MSLLLPRKKKLLTSAVTDKEKRAAKVLLTKWCKGQSKIIKDWPQPRVVGYIRTLPSGPKDSADRQELTIKMFCSANSYELVAIHRDICKMERLPYKRSGWNALCRDLMDVKANVVVSADAERITLDIVELQYLNNELDSHNISLRYKVCGQWNTGNMADISMLMVATLHTLKYMPVMEKYDEEILDESDESDESDEKITSTKPPKVFGYVRVSTKNKQETSVVNQEAAIWSYCREHKLQLLCIFTDRASGGTALSERPEGKKMCKFLANGDAVGVICTRLDRAFRDPIDSSDMIKEFTRRNVQLLTIYEGSYGAKHF